MSKIVMSHGKKTGRKQITPNISISEHTKQKSTFKLNVKNKFQAVWLIIRAKNFVVATNKAVMMKGDDESAFIFWRVLSETLKPAAQKHAREYAVDNLKDLFES